MASLLAVRDPLADAKDTLSSWDKCMAKSYCKWPVIVAIIVGSLIILSVVLCIARCVCCGAEVACCCFKCCTCCCPSGGKSKSGHKRVNSEPPPPVYSHSAYSSAAPAPAPAPVDTRPVNQQYRSHAAPAFTTQPEPPQFARFDAHSKPVNEDALPAMPIWNEAKSVQVEEEVIPEKRGDVEMDRLNQNGSVAASSVSGGTVAGAARRSPGPGRQPPQRSPTHDSYGIPLGYQNDSYAGSGGPRRSPRDSPGPYGGQYGQQQDNYRGASPVQSLSPVYGLGAGYAQNQYDRRSPGPGYNQQQQQQYRRPSPAHSPSPVSSNGYGYGRPPPPREPLNMPTSDQYTNTYAPAPAPVRSPSPGYSPPAPQPPAPSGPSYPGQQTYESSGSAYPGQQTYQAFQPGQAQSQQYSGVSRKALEGSWKDL